MIDADIINRFGHNAAGDAAKWRLLVIHSIATEAAEKICKLCPASRELAQALMALQESAMWARESILCHQELLGKDDA